MRLLRWSARPTCRRLSLTSKCKLRPKTIEWSNKRKICSNSVCWTWLIKWPVISNIKWTRWLLSACKRRLKNLTLSSNKGWERMRLKRMMRWNVHESSKVSFRKQKTLTRPRRPRKKSSTRIWEICTISIEKLRRTDWRQCERWSQKVIWFR